MISFAQWWIADCERFSIAAIPVSKHVTQRHILIVKYARKLKKLTAKRLASMIGISHYTIANDLKFLEKNGHLKLEIAEGQHYYTAIIKKINQ